MVPKQSAAFDGHTVAKQVKCPNHDHLDMKDGTGGPCDEGVSLFKSVERDLKDTLLTISSPLTITSQSSSYSVGQTITAKFAITNKGSIPITVAKLTVGGHDPDGQPADFPAKTCVTIQPNASFNYQGSMPLSKTGKYQFFPAYETSTTLPACPNPDGNWNTEIPTDSAIPPNLHYTLSNDPSLSNPLPITVGTDNTDPIVSITAPSNGDNVSGTYTVIADATDDTSVAKVEFYLNNVLLFTDSNSPYQGAWDTTKTFNGSHKLSAKAYDAASNIGISPVITVTVSNPSGGNNSPATPTSLTQYKSDGSTVIGIGGITNESTIVLKGNVSDPDGDPVSLEVEIQMVGTTFSNSPSSNCATGTTVGSGGTSVVTCSALVDGSYHWQARTKDSEGTASGWVSAGGNSESSADFIVSAGSGTTNYPPKVTVISPNGGETLIAGGSYTIKWIATDDQQVQSVGLLYSTDGGVSLTVTAIPGATVLANTGSYQWTVPNISTSTARVAVTAFDGTLTNIDMSDSNFNIVINCAKPSTPSLQGITPSSGSYTVNWTASNVASYYNLQEDTSSSFSSPSVVYTNNQTNPASLKAIILSIRTFF